MMTAAPSQRLAAADIPAWTPKLVADIALRLPPSLVVRRLVTDARLHDVWKRLLQQTAADIARVDLGLLWFERRDAPLGLTRDGLSKYPAQERAAAAFFVSVIDAFADTPILKTRVEFDAQAQRFADAVELCAQEREGAYDGALRDALDIVARHFAYRSTRLQTASGPEVLERSAKDRSSDDMRIKARLIATAYFQLYGDKRDLLIIKTIMTVATGVEISKKNVENWTKFTPSVKRPN